MNLDVIEDFVDSLLSTGVSLDSMSFDDLTTLMADAGIDVSDLTDDQIQRLVETSSAEGTDALGNFADIRSDLGEPTPDPGLVGIADAPANLHELVRHHGFNDSYSLTSRQDSHALRFEGLEHTATIAGSQGSNPWCGVHSVGNFVQECYPGTGEWVNNHILNLAYTHGGLVPAPDGGFALSIAHYKPLLEGAFNIPCHWETFDPARAAHLLDANHGILVVGDAHDLNPNLYARPSTVHAFNLTDVKIDGQGHTWFKGLDSNVAGKESWWPADAVQSSLAKGHMQYGVNMLVTDTPTRWPWKNS